MPIALLQQQQTTTVLNKSNTMKPMFLHKKALALLLLLLLSIPLVRAQVSSGYAFSYNTTAYTAISAGTSLASGTGASMDDALYTGVPIGFTFKFNNTNYTSVGVSTNGFIWFGTNNPLAATYSPISYAGSLDGAISVYGMDLVGHPAGTATPELRYKTTGTAPNRVFTVEWFCVRAKSYSAGSGSCGFFGFDDINRLDLQIRIYESQNFKIEVQNLIAPYCLDGSFSAQVGLRGGTNSDFNNRLVNCSGNSWASPAQGGANTSTCTISESPSCYPAANAVYTWSPPPPPTPVQCDYSFSYSTSTTYAAFPATGPTTLITGTTANAFRYGAWPAQSLGFTFVYNGQNYTQVGVCSKGYIWFGANDPTGIGTNTLSPSTNVLNSTANIDGVVAGLNSDWVGRTLGTNSTGGANGSIRTYMTGTAPNRVFAIEWCNVRPNSAAEGATNRHRTDFQILLYETSNKIEIAFNVNPYPYTSYNQAFQCGLRANTNSNTLVRSVAAGSGGAGWVASTLGTSSSTVTIGTSGSTYPPTNARYIFTPTGAAVTCTWNGSTSNNWHTASNWTPALVPNVCNNVIVPVLGSGVYPQIGTSNDNAFCRNLTVQSGASLNTLLGYTGVLKVYGNVVNNGSIVVEGSNLISLVGGLDKTIGGTGNYTLAKFFISESSAYSLQNNLSGSTSALLELNIAGSSVLNMNNHDLTVYSITQSGIIKQGSGTLSIEGPTSVYSFAYTAFQAETGTTFFSSGTIWGPANQTAPSLPYNNLKVRTNNGYTVTLGTTLDFDCQNFDVINPGPAGGIATTARNMNVKGNITLGALPDDGSLLILNHCLYRSVGTGTFSMGNSDDNLIKVTKPTATGPNAAAIQGYGALTFFGTVTYDTNSPQTVMSANYKNMNVSGGNGVRSMNGPIIVGNNLSIASGTLNAIAAANFIQVGGDYTNTATYVHNGNTVSLNGLGTQHLQAGTSHFHNLTFDGVDIQFVADNATVENQLILTKGLISTNAQKLIVSNSSTSAVQNGVGNTGYGISWINGTLRRSINSNGDYEFPVGNAMVSQNGVLSFNNITGPTTIDAWFRPLANSNDADLSLNETGIMGNPSPHPYYKINPAGCWVMEPNVQPSGGSYDIKLYLNGFAGLQDNRFGIVKRSVTSNTAADWGIGGGSLNADNGAGRMVADGYALRNNLTSFSEFGIGQYNGSPLPVILSQFWGTKEENGNVLTWVTSSELNSNYFAVERSINGRDFSVIGMVKAVGYSQSATTYHYTDEALKGTVYYRLRCVDTDRSYRYSNIITIKRNSMYETSLSVYPNPAAQTLNLLIISTNSEMAHIRIYDMLGRMCAEKDVPLSTGSNYIEMNLDGLMPASYYIEFLSETNRIVKPFVKN